MIFAYFKSEDWLKPTAIMIFEKAYDGKVELEASSAVIDEIIHTLKSRHFSNMELARVLEKVDKLPITYRVMLPHIASVAMSIADKYRLSYYDSIYVATALDSDDQSIVSSDASFDKVPGLRRVNPNDFANDL